MASVADFKVEKNVWIDATAASGASAGDDLLVQNIGNHPMRVEVAVTQPAGDTVGLLIQSGIQVEAITEVSENVWVFGRNASTTAHVEIV